MGIVAKYKYDGSVYADLIPEFNSGFTDYTITDEVEGNIIIRTIESESLPTLMRFGQPWEEGETRASDKSIALLEILDMDTSELITGDAMFRYCVNLTSIVCNWNTSNITQTTDMFSICQSLVNIDVSNWETSKFTNIYKIFQDCNALKTLDMRNWNTSNITNFSRAFYSDDNITTLDISNWIISDNADISAIIGENTSLKYIKCNIPNTIQKISSLLPNRTADDLGVIIYQGAETLSSEVISALNSKGWNVVTSPQLIAKYKYDSKIYKNLIPAFNEGYMGFVEDEEVDGNGVVTRKIEHVELPTKVMFGQLYALNIVITDKSKSLLEVSSFNTSNLTSMAQMFRYCINLNKIDCSNWDTSNVTNMNAMFGDCHSLIELDLSYLNTSKVTSIASLVCNCFNLVSIKLSNWNVANIKSYEDTFIGCDKLVNLDLSGWETSNLSTCNRMFFSDANLVKLDISNFNLNNVTNATNMFLDSRQLTDIGMIYCDQSTINKVASLLPTDHNITIWVESDDILQYDQYDHITYKTQKVQDTVHLNSPLLMGDTIEVIDGKTYHVHRYEKVVLDGSEDWLYWSDNTFILGKYNANAGHNKNAISNSLPSTKYGTYRYGVSCGNGYIAINNGLNQTDVNEFKQWLQANPTTVIYELVTPYYELISEEPLELTLLDTTDNTINNNSILPSNMTIANKELSTIAIKPSTTYTLSFDKSNVDSEVTIDICGGEQITTVLNRIELTTPSELGSGIRFISSDGCIISNVRLLEGSLVKEAIPKETFEGLKNSFEDGYIIGENLANDKEDYFYEETGNWGNGTILFKQNLKANTTYTLVRKISNIKYGVLNAVSFYDFAYYTDGTYKQDHNCWYSKNGWYISKYTPTKDVTKFEIIVGNDNSSGAIRPRITISDYMIFEGDHTHLSEAELMRYIEKGTSHYEEEDFNHVGKYKVQYKVTGKNKFDRDKFIVHHVWQCTYDFLSDGGIKVMPTTTDGVCFLQIKLNSKMLSESKIYNYKSNVQKSPENINAYTSLWNGTDVDSHVSSINDLNNLNNFSLGLYVDNSSLDNYAIFYPQIEEGTVATEYEPYKEDIKTYYLSSPLLKGDTIEDINGVATHVKRYEKVVLDGGEEWIQGVQNPSTNLYPKHYRVTNGKSYSLIYCDKFIHKDDYYSEIDCVYLENDALIFMSKEDINGFKQWLQANPVTAVYQLASPQYEPISTESILLDSYTNGHLDLSNENIPVEKVEFRHNFLPLKYTSSQTHTIQFEADNDGFIDYWMIEQGGTKLNLQVHKGINRFTLRGGDTKHPCMYISGIGFNASNIQVVATDRDVEFDYFKGLQSSFEDGLVTDETDENYGKYKVECKIVGKNKFDISNLIENDNTILSYIDNGIKVKNNKESKYSASYINLDVKPNTTYSISYKSNVISGNSLVDVYDENNKYFYGSYPLVFNTKNNNKIKVNFFCTTSTSVLGDVEYTNIQIEEGTQATSYEPYKESIHTLYLNSPLLKGDKLVVHDGKLCHYHKKGMIVLDGNNILPSNTNVSNGFLRVYMYKLDKKALYPGLEEEPNCYSNQLRTLTRNHWANFNIESVSISDTGQLTFSKKIDTLEKFKQWLQQNPTTVVYELAEPYYEPIEPQLSQYSFSTVKEGDMDIITALPIEKINLTYRTDINGVSSIEEQIASIQEGTDISSIIDEEVDE